MQNQFTPDDDDLKAFAEFLDSLEATEPDYTAWPKKDLILKIKELEQHIQDLYNDQ